MYIHQIRRFLAELKNPSDKNRARINGLLQKFLLDFIPVNNLDCWIVANGYIVGVAATGSVFFPVFHSLGFCCLFATVSGIKYFWGANNINKKRYKKFMELFGYGFSIGFGIGLGFLAKRVYGVIAISGFMAARVGLQKLSLGLLAAYNKISQYVRFFNLQRSIQDETVASELIIKDLTSKQVEILIQNLKNNPKSAKKVNSLDISYCDRLSKLIIPDNLINLRTLSVSSNVMLSDIFIPEKILANLDIKIYCLGSGYINNPLKTAFNHLNLNGNCNHELTNKSLQQYMDGYIAKIKQNNSIDFKSKIKLVDAVSKKYALPEDITIEILSFLPDSPVNILYSKAFNIISHVFSPKFSDQLSFAMQPWSHNSYQASYEVGYTLPFIHRKNTLIFSKFMDEKRQELKDEINKICDEHTNLLVNSISTKL